MNEKKDESVNPLGCRIPILPKKNPDQVIMYGVGPTAIWILTSKYGVFIAAWLQKPTKPQLINAGVPEEKVGDLLSHDTTTPIPPDNPFRLFMYKV